MAVTEVSCWVLTPLRTGSTHRIASLSAILIKKSQVADDWWEQDRKQKGKGTYIVWFWAKSSLSATLIPVAFKAEPKRMSMEDTVLHRLPNHGPRIEINASRAFWRVSYRLWVSLQHQTGWGPGLTALDKRTMGTTRDVPFPVRIYMSNARRLMARDKTLNAPERYGNVFAFFSLRICFLIMSLHREPFHNCWRLLHREYSPQRTLFICEPQRSSGFGVAGSWLTPRHRGVA
ncbi:predicted protein [Coccidioides posadasii str. Silveira]|uniref:Predicted protein n=1 Tax=Coccidioides posadasii (strain RMSCC 757 / Silveira) TaxID=443226 RepID=E9DAT2_COCPS|nr:predicted protein [Coccidioides posadasii str. Silveira]